MGGYGSGRWDGYTARERVESCFTITAPRGQVAEGQRARVWWPRAGVTVDCAVLDGGAAPLVELRHDYDGGGEQRVRLTSTGANLGGRRWWFRCPGCRAKVRTLHLPRRRSKAREFKCRACHDLTYESAQACRSAVRQLNLFHARLAGVTYAFMRDHLRRALGGHPRPRLLHFEDGETE